MSHLDRDERRIRNVFSEIKVDTANIERNVKMKMI